MAVVHCNKHSVKVTVRFEKKADGEYRWVKKYTLSEEKDEELYSSLLKGSICTAGKKRQKNSCR